LFESAVYRPHPEEPAVAMLRDENASKAWAGLRAQRFEFVSRGDFVPGLLYQSGAAIQSNRAAGKAAPLLLIQHTTADADGFAYAAAWARKGLAVASIDLPLHGTRSSPKLTDRLISGLRQLATGETLDLDTGALVEEFARQTTSDLIRALDALSALPEIDADRIGFMGFGLGAIAGSYLLAHDPRPCAAALALFRGGRGPAELDPLSYLKQASLAAPHSGAPRSFLIIAAEEQARMGKADIDALFQATPEPKELLRLPDNARDLSAEAIDTIEAFLARALTF
jgi:dienelactone hydrolase